MYARYTHYLLTILILQLPHSKEEKPLHQEQPQRPCMHCPGSPFTIYTKHAIVALALVAALLPLTSCGSGIASSQKTSPLKITTSTAFFPTFDPNISDYVSATQAGSPLQVTVNAPPGTQVSVDGQPVRTLAFTTSVAITAGQSFSIVVTSPGISKTYFVRGLPTDFPTWTTERPGTPQAEYYAFTPDIAIANNGLAKHYLIIADGYGVPVWWYRGSGSARNALLLPNGNIAFTVSTGVEEHEFNGTLCAVSPLPAIGGTFDLHELQRLANGDYIIIADVNRGPVDLRPRRPAVRLQSSTM